MKVYLVKRITGFHVGEFDRPRWTDMEPTVKALQHAPIIGIDAEVLQAYYEYLWRLGEWTFGYEYITPKGKVGGPPIEFFADSFINRLWPKWGRMWTAVGATRDAWGWRQVIWQELGEQRLHEVDRRPGPYDIIVRYQEKLWWARKVFNPILDEWFYQPGPGIGYPLMFERRGAGVAKKNEDEWNFGMCWWEGFRTNRKNDMFIWHTAEVRYLGFGIRKSATLLSLQEK